MKKNPHTDRLNFALPPHLKKSIEIAAHARLMSVSEYIRGLVIEDLLNNTELVANDDHSIDNYSVDAYYIAKHKI